MTQTRFTSEPTGEAALQEAEALLQAGLVASRHDDSERALHFFARASAANPSGAMPHFLIGSEFAALGQMDKAEAEIANAVLLAPGLHLARYQLGLLQFSAGRGAVALVTWAPLLALGDDQALSRYVLGFAALAQDDFTSAQNHFDSGLALHQDNPAVATDIRKVLAGMDVVRGNGTAQEVGKPPAQPAADATASHVLVSNYGKFGSLH